ALSTFVSSTSRSPTIADRSHQPFPPATVSLYRAGNRPSTVNVPSARAVAPSTGGLPETLNVPVCPSAAAIPLDWALSSDSDTRTDVSACGGVHVDASKATRPLNVIAGCNCSVMPETSAPRTSTSVIAHSDGIVDASTRVMDCIDPLGDSVVFVFELRAMI